jgi:DNA polymerase-3 subunit epsilon
MRSLLTLDLETTGTDIATDAIISIGLLEGSVETEYLVKPWKPIPPDVEALIGITNEQVKDCAPFKQDAPEIHNMLSQCDIAGFNVRNFDVPITWEELYRAGIEWDLRNTLVIDAGTIFKLREARTLSAAMQFYCQKDHTGAHRAVDDCFATRDVLAAQMQRYPDLAALDRAGLAKASEYDGPPRASLDGKICYNEQGDAVFTFGKNKDQRVRDHIDYAQWMISKDFPEQTKMVLRTLLADYARQRSRPTQKALL